MDRLVKPLDRVIRRADTNTTRIVFNEIHDKFTRLRLTMSVPNGCYKGLNWEIMGAARHD